MTEHTLVEKATAADTYLIEPKDILFGLIHVTAEVGTLAIQTPTLTVGHAWPSHAGPCFKKFLVELGYTAVMQAFFGQPQGFDVEATLDGYSQEIAAASDTWMNKRSAQIANGVVDLWRKETFKSASSFYAVASRAYDFAKRAAAAFGWSGDENDTGWREDIWAATDFLSRTNLGVCTYAPEAQQLWEHIWLPFVAQLKAELAEPEIKNFRFENGAFDMSLVHPNIKHLFVLLGEYFMQSGGKNYVEQTMTLKGAHEELGPLLVTIQRQWGITPGQKAAELQREVTRLRQQLAGLQALAVPQGTDTPAVQSQF